MIKILTLVFFLLIHSLKLFCQEDTNITNIEHIRTHKQFLQSDSTKSKKDLKILEAMFGLNFDVKSDSINYITVNGGKSLSILNKNNSKWYLHVFDNDKSLFTVSGLEFMKTIKLNYINNIVKTYMNNIQNIQNSFVKSISSIYPYQYNSKLVSDLNTIESSKLIKKFIDTLYTKNDKISKSKQTSIDNIRKKHVTSFNNITDKYRIELSQFNNFIKNGKSKVSFSGKIFWVAFPSSYVSKKKHKTDYKISLKSTNSNLSFENLEFDSLGGVFFQEMPINDTCLCNIRYIDFLHRISLRDNPLNCYLLTGIICESLPFYDSLKHEIKIFKINFQKNSSDFNDKVIKEINRYLKKDNLTIYNLTISGFSSVEGSYENNQRLFIERINSFMDNFQSQINDSTIKTTVFFDENWSHFRKSIIGTKYQYLNDFDNETIKLKLEEIKTESAMEDILSKEREATLNIQVSYPVNITEKIAKMKTEYLEHYNIAYRSKKLISHERKMQLIRKHAIEMYFKKQMQQNDFEFFLKTDGVPRQSFATFLQLRNYLSNKSVKFKRDSIFINAYNAFRLVLELPLGAIIPKAQSIVAEKRIMSNFEYHYLTTVKNCINTGTLDTSIFHHFTFLEGYMYEVPYHLLLNSLLKSNSLNAKEFENIQEQKLYELENQVERNVVITGEYKLDKNNYFNNASTDDYNYVKNLVLGREKSVFDADLENAFKRWFIEFQVYNWNPMVSGLYDKQISTELMKQYVLSYSSKPYCKIYNDRLLIEFNNKMALHYSKNNKPACSAENIKYLLNYYTANANKYDIDQFKQIVRHFLAFENINIGREKLYALIPKLIAQYSNADEELKKLSIKIAKK